MDTETAIRAREQARAQLESILEMVGALNAGKQIDGQDASEAIGESPLSVEVRSDWHVPGEDNPTEYLILLCTGGPACRIIGDLGQYQEAETAKLEYQDWFTPWIHYATTDEEDEALLTYAQQFYYGE